MIRSHRCPPPPTACRWCRAGVPLMKAAKAKAAPKTPARRPLCVHLGKRLEFNAGCSGFCRHECDEGHEARPATTCRACPDYEPRG